MPLESLLHELMIHVARAERGVEYDEFNTVSDYAQDLGSLGFPDLLAPLAEGDLRALHDSCGAFDERLRTFLTERSVRLNRFSSLDQLEAHLGWSDDKTTRGGRRTQRD